MSIALLYEDALLYDNGFIYGIHSSRNSKILDIIVKCFRFSIAYKYFRSKQAWDAIKEPKHSKVLRKSKPRISFCKEVSFYVDAYAMQSKISIKFYHMYLIPCQIIYLLRLTFTDGKKRRQISYKFR